MDHSIRGYLSRRTTAELEAILKNSEEYQHVAPEILEILAERKDRETFAAAQNDVADE